MLKSGDINRSFLEVFNSMEEGVEYELTADALDEINKERIARKYNVIHPFSFSRSNKNIVFNWKGNGWSTTSHEVTDFSAFAFAFAFTLAFTLALAFAENRIQRVTLTCDGKVVEIDGKKYKLKLI